MTIRLLQNASLSDVQREMARMLGEGITDPTVRRLAEQATWNTADSIGAVFDFVQATFPYSPDPFGLELFIHPRRIAQDYYSGRTRMGDCDDLALLTGAMLGSLGYQVRIALVDLHGQGIDHALAQVKTPLDWLSIDAASQKPMGWQVNVHQMVTVQ